MDQCMLGGLGRGQNHSRYRSLTLRGSIVSQINKFHQLKSGFGITKVKFTERELINSGGTIYSYEENPSSWVYYDETPLSGYAYIQDKLELEGMVANFGLRLDYYDPQNDPFDLGIDFEDPNAEIPSYYNSFFSEHGGYDSLRISENVSRLEFSPRLGIAHPISDVGKIYFNYGHFFQVPQPRYYFNVRPTGASNRNVIPNLDLAWPKTIQYEVGYEHNINDLYLLHLGAYYKDVSDEVESFEIRSGEMGMGNLQIDTWANNRYTDIRGIELSLEKSTGRFFTFFATLEYSVKSWGRSGTLGIFEDPQLTEERMDLYEQEHNNAVPAASVNLDFHTPAEYGPFWGQFYPLGGVRASLVSGWSDGGKGLYDSAAPLNARHWMEYVDWSNTDMLLEKRLMINESEVVIYAQITNLFNQKRLANVQNYTSYVSSLHLPWESGTQQGDDKYGEYNEDYLDLGWYTWTQFLNPRDVFIGIKISF